MAKKVATTSRRKKKPQGKLVPGLIVLFLFLFVSFSYYAYQIVYTANVDTKDQETYVYIPTGASYEEALDSVEATGVIIDKLSLRFMAKLMDYDAICTFVFPDYLALAKFMYDKDGAALNGDHDNFMDDSQMKMMVGDEYMLIQDGNKVG